MKTKILAAAFVFCMALNGFAQNKNDDNKPCTRGQLAQLIVDTLPWVKDLPDATKEEIKFKDVDITHPDYEAIQLTSKTTIIEYDYPNKAFHPGKNVTRYEVVVGIGRIAEMMENKLDVKFPVLEQWNLSNQPFTDFPDNWAYYEGWRMYETGIIIGYPDNTFKGKQTATIKEVKLVLQRIKGKTEALLKEKEAQNKPSLELSSP